MNQDDPFGNYLDDDKTVLKPSPGRRNQSATIPPILNVQQDISSYTQNIPMNIGQLNLHSNKNVLVGCSLPLLSLVNQLRNTASHADVPELRNAIINEIKTFDMKAKQSGCPVEQVQTARYALCSLIDEVVLNTPWGCNSIWSTQGMLISFHKESWGGEKFFQVLDNIISQPGTYYNLLELYYYCLSLGFEGKFKIQEQGQNKLYDVRENLYQVIQRHKGDFEQDLSIRWRGITDKRHKLLHHIPLWVITAVVAAILMLVFIGFLYVVNQKSGVNIGEQYQINDALNIKTLVEEKPESVLKFEQLLTPNVDKVRAFLAKEIAAKKVAVVDQNGHSIIRILAKNFFASGSDKIQSQYLPLMQNISEALEVVTGVITVVGHTDNIPIFTVRFPSNWVLSKARAQSVADILLKNVKHKDQVNAEGRSDTQSLVPNDSAKHRAMNRRVEINF